MLIRNLNFFEQVDSANDVQGAASVQGYAVADSFRDNGVSAAIADAGVVAKGNYRNYTNTGTDAGATPDVAYGSAYFVGTAVDKNGKYAVKYGVDYSLS